MKKIICLLSLFLVFQSIQADSFDKLKEKLRIANCMEYDFISVIESDVFDSVDSTYGHAQIANDGRYNISMGEEVYAYNLKQYFTYVIPNNQLIIEKGDESSNDDILFITKLDEFYKSYILQPDSLYRLVKKENVIGEFPDSLIVRLNKKKQQFEEISFIDINDELNRIIFLSQIYHQKCIDSLLMPIFPDSVERVNLK